MISLNWQYLSNIYISFLSFYEKFQLAFSYINVSYYRALRYRSKKNVRGLRKEDKSFQ